MELVVLAVFIIVGFLLYRNQKNNEINNLITSTKIAEATKELDKAILEDVAKSKAEEDKRTAEAASLAAEIKKVDNETSKDVADFFNRK